MTEIFGLAPAWRTVFALFAVVQVIVSLYLIVRVIEQKRGAVTIFECILVLCVSFTMVQFFAVVEEYLQRNDIYGVRFAIWFGQLPVWMVVAELIAMFIVIGYTVKNISIWEKNHITPRSLKEATDLMQDGLCYYNEIGLAHLVNRKMEQLSMALTGSYMNDACEFWDRLYFGRLEEGNLSIRGGDTPMVMLADGMVYSFIKTKLNFEEGIYEIFATEITSLYDITKSYRESNARLTEMNKRLRAMGEGINRMVIDKEVLEAKIRIHDNLGAMLLASRRYLAHPTPEDRQEIADAWTQNVDLLRHERAETEADDYELLYETAEDVGLTLEVEGELPEEYPIKRLVATAMHECMTNTIRHAKGDRLYIHVTEKAGGCVVEFRNNGDPPDGELSESGGLGSLRRLADECGAGMTVESTPEFVLRLECQRIV